MFVISVLENVNNWLFFSNFQLINDIFLFVLPDAAGGGGAGIFPPKEGISFLPEGGGHIPDWSFGMFEGGGAEGSPLLVLVHHRIGTPILLCELRTDTTENITFPRTT